VRPLFLGPPEALEPGRRQLGIAHRVLNIFVPKVSLKGTGVVALGGQREPAGVGEPCLTLRTCRVAVAKSI
jgi:hypothetical protein